SVEVGRPWQLGNSNWQIEPQAQLSYQYVHLKGFNDDVRNIDAQNDGTLRARLGARLAWNNDNGKQRTSTFYVTANVLHDLTGSRSKASVGQDKLSERYARTWSELGVGAQLAIGKSTYLYGDVSYERSLGGYSSQVYRGTDTAREGCRGGIGLRYTWYTSTRIKGHRHGLFHTLCSYANGGGCFLGADSLRRAARRGSQVVPARGKGQNAFHGKHHP